MLFLQEKRNVKRESEGFRATGLTAKIVGSRGEGCTGVAGVSGCIRATEIWNKQKPRMAGYPMQRCTERVQSQVDKGS